MKTVANFIKEYKDERSELKHMVSIACKLEFKTEVSKIQNELVLINEFIDILNEIQKEIK